jgi:hypothetical protein
MAATPTKKQIYTLLAYVLGKLQPSQATRAALPLLPVPTLTIVLALPRRPFVELSRKPLERPEKSSLILCPSGTVWRTRRGKRWVFTNPTKVQKCLSSGVFPQINGIFDFKHEADNWKQDTPTKKRAALKPPEHLSLCDYSDIPDIFSEDSSDDGSNDSSDESDEDKRPKKKKGKKKPHKKSRKKPDRKPPPSRKGHKKGNDKDRTKNHKVWQDGYSSSSSSSSLGNDSSSDSSNNDGRPSRNKQGIVGRQRWTGSHRRRHNRKASKKRVEFTGSDPSVGDKKCVYGMQINEQEIDESAGPEDMRPRDADELYNTAVDVTSLPGMFNVGISSGG